MILLATVAILVFGNQLSEQVRIKQEEAILRKLPEQEALAYYELLKKRVRRVQIMRGLVLVSFVVIMFAYKKIFMSLAGTP